MWLQVQPKELMLSMPACAVLLRLQFWLDCW